MLHAQIEYVGTKTPHNQSNLTKCTGVKLPCDQGTFFEDQGKGYLHKSGTQYMIGSSLGPLYRIRLILQFKWWTWSKAEHHVARTA